MGRFEPSSMGAIGGPGPDFSQFLTSALGMVRQQRLDQVAEEDRESRTQQVAFENAQRERALGLEERRLGRQERADRIELLQNPNVRPIEDVTSTRDVQTPELFQGQHPGSMEGEGNPLSRELTSRVSGGGGGGQGVVKPGQFTLSDGGRFNGPNPQFSLVGQQIGMQQPVDTVTQLEQGYTDIGDGMAMNPDRARQIQQQQMREAFAGLDRGGQMAPLVTAGMTPNQAFDAAHYETPEQEREQRIALEQELENIRLQGRINQERGVIGVRQELGTVDVADPLDAHGPQRAHARALDAAKALTGLDAQEIAIARSQGRDLRQEVLTNFGFGNEADLQATLQSGGGVTRGPASGTAGLGLMQAGRTTLGEQEGGAMPDIGVDPQRTSRAQQLRAQFPNMPAQQILDTLRREGFEIPQTR